MIGSILDLLRLILIHSPGQLPDRSAAPPPGKGLCRAGWPARANPAPASRTATSHRRNETCYWEFV